jgi:hypothetical protein
MGEVLRYRGDRVDDLVAMGEAGHLFGPDICGSSGVSREDVANACRLGMTDVVRIAASGELPKGAHYELVSASYDDTHDVTIAEFRPHINPLHRQRFHGGAAGPNLDPPTLAKRDEKMRHAK